MSTEADTTTLNTIEVFDFAASELGKSMLAFIDFYTQGRPESVGVEVRRSVIETWWIIGDTTYTFRHWRSRWAGVRVQRQSLRLAEYYAMADESYVSL